MRRRWTKTSDKAGVQSFECGRDHPKLRRALRVLK